MAALRDLSVYRRRHRTHSTADQSVLLVTGKQYPSPDEMDPKCWRVRVQSTATGPETKEKARKVSMGLAASLICSLFRITRGARIDGFDNRHITKVLASASIEHVEGTA